MKRLDVFLVEKGWARSRSQAQEKIKKGYIQISNPNSEAPRWETIQKPSFVVQEGRVEVREIENSLDRFVSRAGLKLEGALRFFDVRVAGLKVLDIGASTGGFTDCCLQYGAKHVFAIDVGHNQLCRSLIHHPQVAWAEGVNARHLDELFHALKEQKYDLIVMDVSFISIKLILPNLRHFLHPGGQLISLVKPQFELGPDALGKGGLVKSKKFFPQLEMDMTLALKDAGFIPKKFTESSLLGGDGNQEFFIWGQLI